MPPALVASLSQNQMLDNNSCFVSLQCRPSGSHGSQIHDLMVDLLSQTILLKLAVGHSHSQCQTNGCTNCEINFRTKIGSMRSFYLLKRCSLCIELADYQVTM
jgi:hypothetical protein